MANFYTQFSCLLPVRSAANIPAALDLYAQLKSELDAEGETIGFSVEPAQKAGHEAMLWLWDEDGGGEPEHVIAFAFRCAAAFGLTGRWGFAWSLSCSRPRIDGFGGGAQVLDLGRRESVAWVDCENWLAELTGRNSLPEDGRNPAAVQAGSRGRGPTSPHSKDPDSAT